MYTGIRLLLLICPFISSFFFLSNFQTLKFFVTLFSGTVRSGKLILGTHVNSGQMYRVYRNQAVAAYSSFYFFIFLSLQFSNRKPPLTKNGENDVSTFSRLFLIGPFWKDHIWSCPTVECPWTQWTPWTLSMDSMDIYHGLSGQSGQCPWILWTKSSESMDKVQWDQPDWTMSMDSVDIVHGLSGHCPWTHWTKSNLIWLKKLKLKYLFNLMLYFFNEDS